jgi:hypothetical protein
MICVLDLQKWTTASPVVPLQLKLCTPAGCSCCNARMLGGLKRVFLSGSSLELSVPRPLTVTHLSHAHPHKVGTAAAFGLPCVVCARHLDAWVARAVAVLSCGEL